MPRGTAASCRAIRCASSRPGSRSWTRSPAAPPPSRFTRLLDVARKGLRILGIRQGVLMRTALVFACILTIAARGAAAQTPAQHEHPAPEQLGRVHFETSCSKEVTDA